MVSDALKASNETLKLCTSIYHTICYHLLPTRSGLGLVYPVGLIPVVVGYDAELDWGGRYEAYSPAGPVR